MTSRVFISYAHGEKHHVARVGALIDALRAAGLRVASDRDVTTPQGPPEGWPAWMLDRIDEADWVLVVCDGSYYRRFRGTEAAGLGLGVRWEGSIIGTALYNEGTRNRKFVPLLFGEESISTIPEPLRGSTRYRLPDELSKLMKALNGQPGTAADQPEAGTMPDVKRGRGLPQYGRGAAEILPYALLSLGSFFAGLLLLVLLLTNARLVVSLGLEGRFYYLVLLALGLAVTGFAFGALRSFALYYEKPVGGTLALGGPIVGFALVVIGGFLLPPPASNFPLTVYVHGAGGPQELPLRNEGAVLLDLGGDRRREPIGDRGQAVFPEVPANFRGQKVNVALDAVAYEPTDRGQRLLEGTSVYLRVQRRRARITGTVLDSSGSAVAGAAISVSGMSTLSDAQGQFTFKLPPERLEDRLVVRVVADGYQAWSQEVLPNGGTVTAVLQR